MYKDGALGGADEDAAVDASVSDVGGGLAYFVSFGACDAGQRLLVNCDACGSLAHVNVAINTVHDAELLETGKPCGMEVSVQLVGACAACTSLRARTRARVPGNSRLPGSLTSTLPFCF